ncbi:hypothetical protein HS088_TW06G00955 [Tripterygium wilfordii]|uniref:Serine hydrolase domain-containing protein n=1 Tax=Tripterygium wilfordii TaxID=458696 RepID=A0A7J7DK88_TRIWF|nr:hypothetical protein HS088_TW06G00955 [Tripterygium wilfordii]
MAVSFLKAPWQILNSTWNNMGVALKKVPKIKFLIIIGGAKFKSPTVAEQAYSAPIQCPTLHFLDEKSLPMVMEFLERIQKMVSP